MSNGAYQGQCHPSIPETGRPARIEISHVIKLLLLLLNNRASAIVMYGRGHTALHACAHVAFSYCTSTSYMWRLSKASKRKAPASMKLTEFFSQPGTSSATSTEDKSDAEVPSTWHGTTSLLGCFTNPRKVCSVSFVGNIQ